MWCAARLARGDAAEREPHGGGHAGAAQARSEPVLLLLLLGLVGRLLVLVPVAGVLADRVVVPVVDDAQLAQRVAPDRRLYRPVVAVVRLGLPVEPFHVKNFGTESLENDPDVFNSEVPLLIDAQLVDQ